MASRIVRHLRTHAIAYVAVFLALGAGSVATAKKKKIKIPPNSIGSGKLKDKVESRTRHVTEKCFIGTFS